MKEYYYIDLNQNKIGPLSIEEMKVKNIFPETYVWKNGMADWVQAKDMPEMAEVLGNKPPQFTHADNTFNNQQQAQQRPLCPPTNLVWGILVTVLCCMPLGIVSIIKAAEVERYYYTGFYDEALRASNSAKNWALAGAIITLVFLFLYFILLMIGVAAGI